MKNKQISKIKKEFKWNQILPKKDYLYFLDARLYSHSTGLIKNNKYSNTPLIVMYNCLKENGDLNSVFLSASSINFKLNDGFVIDFNNDLSEFNIFNQMRTDVLSGQIGQYVYYLTKKQKCYFLHKIPLKLFNGRKQIVKKLNEYRHGGVKTVNNELFNNYFDLVVVETPEIIVDPSKNKRKKLFQGVS